MTAQLYMQQHECPQMLRFPLSFDVEIRNIRTEVQYLPSWAMFPKFEIPHSAHAPGPSNLGGRLLDTN
jgi:hypothetical protein